MQLKKVLWLPFFIKNINLVQWLMPIILAIREVESGGSWSKASYGKKFKRPNSTNKSWALWCIPVMPAMLGSVNRRITLQADQCIK
jgi:hypothetical protein